ncbi:hypothetical protein [Microbacterium sp.]|uniref:hypothetical protein n=1 Tax=Microbacterium sp. TaxID=51671 RepID=UPI002E31284E|nr:hypothetical protein [Microbacterium sp.]HEX5730135.1 hypothetical protein [Microbacterium sp.]
MRSGFSLRPPGSLRHAARRPAGHALRLNAEHQRRENRLDLPGRPPEGRPDLPSRPQIAAAALASAALLLALTACAPSATTAAPTPPGLPDGVTAQLVQLRSDVAARQAQVELHNDGDTDLSIGALAVSDPRFEGDATRVLERDSLVRAGATVDIRIQLPDMDCAASESGASALAFTYTVDARPRQAEAPIDDPLDFIGPLHERECRADAVADAAALTLASFTPSAAGQPADLLLEIAPTGDAAVEVVGIQTTNLLTFAGAPGTTADTFPIAVSVAAGDTDPHAVHLPLVPLRCDPHAVQEDKRGTIFTLEVQVDGEPGEIELAASEDMRGSILTWVANWCGFGSG